jgi:hypothetical protein
LDHNTEQEETKELILELLDPAWFFRHEIQTLWRLLKQKFGVDQHIAWFENLTLKIVVEIPADWQHRWRSAQEIASTISAYRINNYSKRLWWSLGVHIQTIDRRLIEDGYYEQHSFLMDIDDTITKQATNIQN